MEKKNMSYIIWIGALAGLYIIFKNPLFGVLCLSAIVMLGVSIIISKIIIMNVDISIEIKDRKITREDKAEFGIKVSNRTIFPTNKLYVKVRVHNAFFKDKEEFYINIPVVIHDDNDIAFDIKCDYVGNIQLEVVEIVVRDYLEVMSSKKSMNKSIEVMVMPRDIDYSVPLETTYDEADEGDKQVLTIDSTQLRGVREYRDGESLHRIHWKLSAKYDELMVKEFEMSLEANTLILLDLIKGHYEYLNHTIEVLYSMLSNLVGKVSKGFTVNWYDSNRDDYMYYDIYSIEDIDTLLEYIYETNLGDESGLVYHAYTIKNDIVGSANAILITDNSNNLLGDVIGVYDDKVVLKCV